MEKVTFMFDVQLNDNEDWMAKGTVVSVSDNEYYLNKHAGYIPVIVDSAYNFEENKIKLDPSVEWFTVGTFKQLNDNITCEGNCVE